MGTTGSYGYVPREGRTVRGVVETVATAISAHSQEGPEGVVRYLPNIRPDDFTPRVYVPTEKRSEEPGLSTSTSWTGDEVGASRYDRFSAMDQEDYTLEARVLAENYRSPWEEIDELTLPDDFVIGCRDKDNWHDRWDDSFLQFVEDELENAIEERLEQMDES